MALDMAFNALQGWHQYISQEDFDYLIQYVENIKDGILNDEIIILFGRGRNGKTTLMYHIRLYLGRDIWDKLPDEIETLICEENIKPLILVHERMNNTNKNCKRNRNLANAVINFMNYGISFIIAINEIETVNQKIIEHSKIITMTHIFPNTL
jgi:hypothetical protein